MVKLLMFSPGNVDAERGQGKLGKVWEISEEPDEELDGKPEGAGEGEGEGERDSVRRVGSSHVRLAFIPFSAKSAVMPWQDEDG